MFFPLFFLWKLKDRKLSYGFPSPISSCEPKASTVLFHRITDSYIFSLEILWTKGALNLASSFNFEVAMPVHCAYVIHINNLLFTAWSSHYVIHISTYMLCLCRGCLVEGHRPPHHKLWLATGTRALFGCWLKWGYHSFT